MMGWWSAAGMGATFRPRPALPLQHCPAPSGIFGSASFPRVSSCPVGCAKSQQECLPLHLRPVSSLWVWDACVCLGWCGGGGVVSVLALLTSRRSTLPAPSMSAHTPLPCRLDLTVGGDDGENLGSWRGVDPEESERQRETYRSLPSSHRPILGQPDLIW